jgi:GNAT superfamily N-acetyltransferase
MELNTDRGGPRFSWCRTASHARELAALFARNVAPDYISHGEMQGLRAIDPSTFVWDIPGVLEAEIMERIDRPLDAPPEDVTRLAVGLHVGGEAPSGVFLVVFDRRAAVPFCVIEDCVVEEGSRGRGLGSAFIEWIAAECAMRGIRRLFIESGARNGRAHGFFARHGFEHASVVMMRELA